MPISASRSWTIAGLAIALISIPLITTLFRLRFPDAAPNGALVLRELLILSLVGFLLWIVTSRERLPLSSIGLRFNRLGQSIGWGLVFAFVCLAAAIGMLALYSALGVRYGEGVKIAPSLPVTTLAVIRAGIAEEAFYRGYALERLQSLTGSKWAAAAITLLAFAGFHYRQGIEGVVLALILGAVLTALYLWKRNLLAAMIAHFLVDFIPNVLLPLLGEQQG